MPLWQAPAVLVIVVTWLTAPPTSLADLSRREALRRQLSAASAGTFSNDTLPYMPPPVMSAESTYISRSGAGGTGFAGAAEPGAPGMTAGSPAGAPAGQVPAGPPVPPPPVPEPDEEPQGEDYWRNRMDAARAALDRDQVLRDAMQTRVNSLQSDIVNRDDPAQRSLLQQQLNRALGELERLARQIETDEQEIATIQTEARRQGIPPGWIR